MVQANFYSQQVIFTYYRITTAATWEDWDTSRWEDSPMATQQISDQDSKRSPRCPTLHTLLSAALNLSRGEENLTDKI